MQMTVEVFNSLEPMARKTFVELPEVLCSASFRFETSNLGPQEQPGQGAVRAKGPDGASGHLPTPPRRLEKYETHRPSFAKAGTSNFAQPPFLQSSGPSLTTSRVTVAFSTAASVK